MKKSRAIYMLLCFTIINAVVCMVLYHMLDVRPRKQITQAVKWMYKVLHVSFNKLLLYYHEISIDYLIRHIVVAWIFVCLKEQTFTHEHV